MFKEKKFIKSQILFESILEELKNRPVQFTVTGMSMWPFICHGRDQVIIEKCRLDDIKVGDIVLYKISSSQYILHRITDIKNRIFETTGDGNCYRDGYYDIACIQAIVTKIIRKNKVINCQNIIWKIIFKVWMVLFPIRHSLLSILKNISHIKNKMRK